MLEELQCCGIIYKIFSITIDNVSNNDAVDTFIKEKKLCLPLRGTLFQLWFSQKKKNIISSFFFWSYLCFCAKISNLIVQDGLPYLSFSGEKK